VQKEASAWLARIDAAALTKHEEDALRDWLAADPSHAEALRKMAQLWGDMDCLALLAALFPLPPEATRPPPRDWLRLRNVAAAVAIASVLTLLLADLFRIEPQLAPALADRAESFDGVYRTKIGEQSRIALKDGSTLTLNTGSAARVRFNARERAVHLTEGEAHFNVAKHPRLPFVVYAGNGQVRALGTAFSVRLSGERVAVLVLEGSVKVLSNTASQTSETAAPTTAADTASATAIVLQQGGSTEYSRRIEGTQYLSEEALNHRMAWHNGKWLFAGETLAEVIDEVSRYTDRRIEITDPQIAKLRIGGYFDIGEIDALMDALQAGFGVEVKQVSTQLIQLSALDSGKAQ
jgi:transmembrane sensor